MEQWQRQNLTQNLNKMVDLIICDSSFSSVLKSKNVLSNAEVSKLAMGTRYDQAKYLLEILETRTNGYEALLEALLETKQTGALNILLRNYLPKILQDLKVNLHGRVFPITRFYPDELTSLWTNLTKTITIDEITKIFLRVGNQKEPFALLKETIPKALEYYVPRTLSKRLQIKSDIFRQKCHDVFVIKGMRRHKLTELAQSNRTANSSFQREEVTVRFINLQERDDWEAIRTNSKSPVHLINYEAEQNKFILEETSGTSSIIRRFLGSDECTLSEEIFMKEINSKKTKSICICDLPGMGKSLLLANLARNAKQDHETAVVFVVLQHFVKFARRSGTSWRSPNDENETTFPLFEHISPSPLGAGILFNLVKDNKITMKIFFDGFDEIGEEDVVWMKQVFKHLTKFPSLTIHVTSRPHMRYELEKTLGVVAYDILPFNEKNQIYFLSEFWACEAQTAHFSMSKLECFARMCLKHFKESISCDERDLAGIPLQCRLIAEVYTKGALRYSNLSKTCSVNEAINFGKSMFELYKNYVDFNYKKFAEKLAMSEPKFGDAICNTVSLGKYKEHLHIIALQTIFPKFGIKLVANVGSYFSSSKETNQLLSCGLLEEVYNGETVALQFIHRTIAEYLVAEFVSDQLVIFNKAFNNGNIITSDRCFLSTVRVAGSPQLNSESNVDMLSVLLFEHMFQTQKHKHRVQSMNYRYRPRGYFFCFLNATLLYFLNYQFGTLFKNTDSITVAMPFLNYPTRQNFLQILESCGYHNYLNVFGFIRVCHSNIPLVDRVIIKYLTLNKLLCEIMSVYFEYSDGVLVENLLDFVKECFTFTINDIIQISNKNNWATPLQYACMRKSYDLLELMVVKLKGSTDKQCLIHFCAEHSVDDTLNETKERIDMIELLLGKNENLIREPSMHNSPILAPGSSLSVIKFLVGKGANICEVDSICLTLAHAATGWLSNSLFHDFIVFVIELPESLKILSTKDMCGRTVLVEALRKVKLLHVETVRLIINETQTDINELDNSEENILFAAVWGGQNVQMLEMLVSMGVDVNILNNKKENLIHLAAQRRHVEALKYLLSLGLDPNIENMNGNTPIQLAQQEDKGNISNDKETNENVMETLMYLLN